jgi:hypothetical protein
LKAARQKWKVIYKSKTIRVTADFSTETLKAKRAWKDIFQVLKENNCQPKYYISSKAILHNWGRNKNCPQETKTKGIHDH